MLYLSYRNQCFFNGLCFAHFVLNDTIDRRGFEDLWLDKTIAASCFSYIHVDNSSREVRYDRVYSDRGEVQIPDLIFGDE